MEPAASWPRVCPEHSWHRAGIFPRTEAAGGAETGQGVDCGAFISSLLAQKAEPAKVPIWG